MEKDRVILHCDANNFYASVEIIDRPDLRDKPVAVCGNPKKRHGIILAKNDIAKKAGVSTGEAIWESQQKCPNLVLLSPRHHLYSEFSRRIFEIYKEYTDRVEPFGIDECWLDVTESTALFGDGKRIADELRAKIKSELGITISVGVSFTKIFAKLGSDMKKPDATTVISKENFKNVVWRQPVENMIMIGRQTKNLLHKFNIFTIGQLATFDKTFLAEKIGINGTKLHDNANGVSDELVHYYYTNSLPESVSNSTTMPYDITSKSEAIAVFSALADLVSFRLRKHQLLANCIGIYIKYNNLETFGKNEKVIQATNSEMDIYENAMRLFESTYNFKTALPIRSLGISTSRLVSDNLGVQCNFLEESFEKKKDANEAIDILRDKYGYNIIKKASILQHSDLCENLQHTFKDKD